VTLSCRLLASDQPEDVYEGAYEFMRDARAVTLQWLRELKTAFRTESAEETTIERQHLICEMAAICRMTYDVESVHLSHLLETWEDVSVVLECAMAVQETHPPELKSAPLPLQLLIRRDERLSHILESQLRTCIASDRMGFDQALLTVWSGYRAGPELLISDDSPWIATQTAQPEHGTIQSVHFNLLDGKLLVNGRPLGRLPASIMTHPTYIRTFGQVRRILIIAYPDC
jgi:hypothetical protein